MSCLVGCVPDYRCGDLKLPVDGHNIAPFVKIFFGDNPDKPEITVGNNSAPLWNNTAIIKNFEFGMSNGIGMKAEIIDEQGGAFHLFIEKLNKCMAKASNKDQKMNARWGWIVTNCDGSTYTISSPTVTVIPIHCEILFAEGKIKFIIQGQDLMQHVFSSRHDEIEGTEDARIPLKLAIRNLALNTEPKFNVEFMRREKNGTIAEYGFKEGGFLGPKMVWDCDGQNKLATIQKWLEPFVTDREKGIVAQWATNKQDTLILMEDPTPDCNEAINPCFNSLGTYIVNGGSCSPVLSFTPQLNWIAAFGQMAAGGNDGGAATGATKKKEKNCGSRSQTRETGIAQSIPITRYAWEVHGPKNALTETEDAQNKHDKANSINGRVGSLQAINAELRIQGDPSPDFVDTMNSKFKTLSLVVINPFHLFGDGNGGCGDWLANPGCNESLSNRNWMINGISHQIREGSYTTTISLFLKVPGIELDANAPFGGEGSNGYVPINAC